MPLDEKEKQQLLDDFVREFGGDDVMVIVGRLLNVDDEGNAEAYDLTAYEAFSTTVTAQALLEMSLMAITDSDEEAVN